MLTDPYSGASLHLPKDPAVKVITLSRTELADIALGDYHDSPRVIKGPGEYEVANVLITGVATQYESRSEQGETVRSKNTVYAIELEGLVLCHLGELQAPLSSEHIEGMRDVSILLVPVGNPTSFRASMDTISLLEPKLVIPMDYSEEGESPSEAPSAGSGQALIRFLKEMSAKEAEPQKRLHITSSTLPQQTQVAVLENPT